MSEARRDLPRVVIAVLAVALVGAVVYGLTRGTTSEPQGVAGRPIPDAGDLDDARDLDDAGVTRTIARFDGAVQMHLPVYASPIADVLGPDEMRARRQAQLELIEQRIEELEQTRAQLPHDTVVGARIEQLRERRDTLRRLVSEDADPEPAPPDGL